MEGTNPIEMLNELVPELKESFNAAYVIPFGDTGFGITQYMLYAILVWIIVLAVVMLVGKRLTLVKQLVAQGKLLLREVVDDHRLAA